MYPIGQSQLPFSFSTFGVKGSLPTSAATKIASTLASTHQATDIEASSNCFLELIEMIWEGIKSLFCCYSADTFESTISVADFKKDIHAQQLLTIQPNTSLIITDVTSDNLEKIENHVKEGKKDDCIKLILSTLNQFLLLTGCHLKSMSFNDLVIKIIHTENSFTLTSPELITFNVAKLYHFRTTLEHLYHSMISDHNQFTLESDQTLQVFLSSSERVSDDTLIDFLHSKVPENYKLELQNETFGNLKPSKCPSGFILTCKQPITLTLSPK